MKKAEIKKLSSEELKAKIKEAEFNLRKLKFAHAVSSIENPMMLRNSRRTIARMKTELRAK